MLGESRAIWQCGIGPLGGRFTNQIIVENPSDAFILPGDSGSLMVTDDPSANPVGLLFAGNADGTMAMANPIDAVLQYFRVTIDGK